MNRNSNRIPRITEAVVECGIGDPFSGGGGGSGLTSVARTLHGGLFVRGGIAALALMLVAATVGGVGTAGAQTEATPQVSSTGPFTVAEGSVKVAQMTAEGFSEDAEDLFWSILTEADSGADGDKFKLRLDNVLEFVEPPDFEQPADADADNVYVVTVKVSNGAATDPAEATADISVTVTDVGFVAFDTSTLAVDFDENRHLRVATLDAGDPVVEWSLSGPDAGWFRIAGGALRFRSQEAGGPPDFESPGDSGADNVYVVTVAAEEDSTDADTTDVSSVAVSVTILNVDEPGAVKLLPDSVPAIGEALTASLSDPDGGVTGIEWVWERSVGRSAWEVIDTATSATYTPAAADSEDYLRVTATYTDALAAAKTAKAVASSPPLGELLSSLSVATSSARQMYPAFDPEVLHYAVGCDSEVTLSLSVASPDARVSVDGIQQPASNAEVTVSGLHDGVNVANRNHSGPDASDIKIVLSDAGGSSTTYVVHCIHDDYPEITPIRNATSDGVIEDLILLHLQPTLEAGVYPSIVDTNGVPRFHRHTSGNGPFFRVFHIDGRYRYAWAQANPGTDNQWIILNEYFTVLDNKVTTASPLVKTNAHDFRILDNGNYLLMSYEPAYLDLRFMKTLIPEISDPARVLTDDSVVQIITPRKPNGTAVLTWNSFDQMDVRDCLSHRFPRDYAHGNSLQYWEPEGRDQDWIVVSLRGCSAVAVIDADTAETVARIGRTNLSAEEWAAAGKGDPPMPVLDDPHGEFCGQHSAWMLPHEHLVLFDNGNSCLSDARTGETVRNSNKPDLFSRAVEYALDLDNGEAVFVRHHSLHGAENRLGRSSGHVDVLDNGDWLIGWGRASHDIDLETAWGPDEAVTQADPDTGEEKFALQISEPDGVLLDVDGDGDTEREQMRVRPIPLSPVALAPDRLELEAGFAAGSEHTSGFFTSVLARPTLVVSFNQPVVDFDETTASITVSGGSLESVAPHVVAGEPAHSYLLTLAPDGEAAITVSFVASQPCDADGVCTADGSTLSEVPSAHRVRYSSPPVIDADSLALEVDENTIAVGRLSATDDDTAASGLTWSLAPEVAGPDDAEFTLASTGVLNLWAGKDFEAPDDANGDRTYEVMVQVSDGESTVTALVEVTLADVDEAPTVTGDETLSFPENGTAALATYGAVDPEDPSALITRWSLSGSDAGDFAISETGELSFRNVPDYERPADSNRDNVYGLSVRASDGRNYGNLEVTVTVSDVDEAPTVTGDEALSYPENGTAALATYRAMDPENAVVAWSVSGTDSDDFAISGTGVLSFAAVPDFENPADADRDNVYEVSVVARDDGFNAAVLDVIVTVTNSVGPEEPTITTTSSPSPFRENGTGAVHTFRARDPQGRPVVWTVTGIDSDALGISSGGVLRFVDVPDFESPADADGDNVYEVVVVATDDQGLADSVAVAVTVSDVDEGPVVSGPQSLSLAENQATDRVLAMFGAVDPEDPSGPVTRWSLSGTDAGDFSVSEAGELSFRKVPDFERPADSDRDNVYSLSVRASDGRSYGYLAVTVTVTDVDEAPEIAKTANTALVYRENGTAVLATFRAADPEEAVVAWSLSGPDGEHFAIYEGVLTFKRLRDFESPADTDGDNVYEVTVVAADDGLNAGALAVTVTVSDVNEGPEVLGPQSLSFAENQATDEILATYRAVDPEDPSGTITRWSLSGTDAGDFSVSDTGELSFRRVPDHERPADSNRDNVYSLSVRASDGRNYGYLAVTVTVSDIDEAPEITTTARTAFAYRENGTAAIYTFSAADPEQSAVSWSAEGADGGDFEIARDSRGRGVLSFAGPPDFENPADAGRDNVYEVTVVATDDQGLNAGTLAVTVTVSDVNEGPVVSGPQSLSFAENQATDRVLGTYDADDPEDPSGTITRWSLSGTDAGDFAVSDTGELSFRKVPDYERPADSNKDNVYSLSVRASDGRNYGYLAVTVTIEDVNEAPEITTTARTAFAYRENGTAAIYTFSAADPEKSAVAWSLGGADGDDFEIASDSRGRGVLSFSVPPDFENPADADQDNVYEVTVVAADDQGLTDTVAVTVTVTDHGEGPVVSGPQSLSFAENQATDRVLAFYAASDPEDPSGTITRWGVSGTDAGDFAVSETGELSFRRVPDFERPADSNRDNVYSLSVRASDGRNYGYLAVTVTVTDIDEAPEITTTAKTVFAYRENGTAAIYTFSAADPEQAAVAWSAGGADGGIFAVTPDSRGRGVLAFAGPPDFENPADAGRDNVYEVTVVATDDQGLNAGTLAVTVTVSDVNEGPAVSGPQSLSFAENQATDQVLGTYGAVDPEDPSGPITRWSLSGTDAGDFSVSETGELTFRKVPDYERPADSNRDNVYSLSVRASDGRNYGYLAVTVTVTDIDEAPEITTTAKTVFAYRENGTAAVYTFSAVDPEQAAVAWSAGGADSGIFAVTPDSRGRGVLAFADPPDFENPADADQDNVYEVTVVAADDQGLTDTVAVTVTVTDHGEGPVVSGPQSLSFAENQATDRVLAFYAASDPEDPSGPITRWGVSGTDAGDFAVSETGELSFRRVPDFERPADSNRDNVYSLSVRASDGRNYGYLAVTVTVTDVNEAPEITTTARTVFVYRENGAAAVFTFSAADPERATIAWSAGGGDGGDFEIVRDSRGRGVLSFADVPDFENPADADRDNVYEVTVVATDDQGLNAGTLAVTVTVSDVNEGPAVSGPRSLSLAENQATDEVLGFYGAVDPENPSGPITRWSLSGTDAGDFSVSDTGELSFRTVPDFERPADSNRDNVYSLSVRASDGRNYGYLAVTVTVTDVNEAPEITTTAKTAFAYRENGTAAVYTFSAADPERAVVAWSAGGADGDDFEVARDSRGRGVLSFAGPPDFEKPADADGDNVYEVTVVADDDQGLTDTLAVTVTVTDHGEGPVVSGPQGVSLAENQATDRVLGTYDAVDPEDPSGPITRWSLSGTDAGDFSVSETGELTFRKVPDYERPADSNRDNVYSLSVRASDGRNYGYLAVTVTVTDIDEAPEITTTAKTEFAYRENGTAAVFTFSAADPEKSAVAWSAEGADGDDFEIARDSRGRGVLSFADPPDFENPADAGRGNVYEVTVVATDDQGLTDTVAVTVTVSDVNEGPAVSGPQSLSFAENQATDRVLGTYDAVDPENPSGPITRWSLSGTDASDFSVSETGELTFRKVPDYERPADSNRDNVYSLSVRASDGRNYGYLAVTVTIGDVNEAPEITTTAKTAFAYRENGTAAVFTFSAADPEKSAVAWSAGGADGGHFAIARDSRGRGVLSFADAPDFENPADADGDNVYEVTVVAADDGLNVGTVAVAVTVSDLNEGPVVSGPQSLSFAENQATDETLATYGAVDPENPSGPITRWSLSGTDAGDFAVSETGELTFRKVLDHERPADSNRDNVYSLSVRASDGRSYGYLAVTVTVTDVNEAPDISGSDSIVFQENGTNSLAAYRATDQENGTISWNLSGTDSNAFTISDTGILAFANPPDYEQPTDSNRNNVYQVIVEATDPEANTALVQVTVTVTNQTD